jgi:DNA-binding MarR family transcriptional regulator
MRTSIEEIAGEWPSASTARESAQLVTRHSTLEARIEVSSARMPRKARTSSSSSPAAGQLDPVLDFLRLLWSVEHGLQRSSKKMESTVGITGPQRLVLRIVGKFPGLSAGELARIIYLHPSTITGIVQRLASRGFLTRQRDPGDTRRVRLRLKARGKAFTRPSSGLVERAVTRALAGAGDRRIRAARELLEAVAHALTESD